MFGKSGSGKTSIARHIFEKLVPPLVVEASKGNFSVQVEPSNDSKPYRTIFYVIGPDCDRLKVVVDEISNISQVPLGEDKFPGPFSDFETTHMLDLGNLTKLGPFESFLYLRFLRLF